MNDIEKRLPKTIQREIDSIPTLSDIVVKVIQLTRNPDATAKQLTDLISSDPGLTGNILKLCNSAYYGIPRVVSSLNQAIMYLGFHTIRSLVITCSLSKLFNPTRRIYGYEKDGLWKHTIACAMTSEMIAKQVRPEIYDTAYTAGLLHDVGQLILGLTIKDTSETIIDLIQNQGVSEIEAEHEAIGVSHDELGAYLADKWNFPEELINAIHYHHMIDFAKGKSLLTGIVHLADVIACDIGIGLELEPMKYQANPKVYSLLNIKPDSYSDLKESAAFLIDEHGSVFMNLIN